MKTRRRARRVTLETLYEYDIAGHDPDEVLAQRLEEGPMAVSYTHLDVYKRQMYTHTLDATHPDEAIFEIQRLRRDLLQRIIPEE